MAVVVAAGAIALMLAGPLRAVGFEFQPRYSCGVCVDVVAAAAAGDAAACERYDACHTVNASTSSCDVHCGPGAVAAAAVAMATGAPDLRVAVGFGTKPYGTVRVSVVTPSDTAAPPLTVDGRDVAWQYSARFVHKWRDNALHTAVLGSGGNVSVGGSDAVAVGLPREGDGAVGVLIGDPCINDASITSLVGCFYGHKFKTATRTPALLNAFVGAQGSSVDFWGILGDNFYDRTGEATKKLFEKLSLATKAKPLLTVPGNHDYWVLGAPEVGTAEDQYANGFMQFYGQDTKAAEQVGPSASGAAAVPYNFSVDPDKHHPLLGGNLPDIRNSFLYHQVGNLAVVGFSGAYSLAESRPLMAEACAWIGDRVAAGSVDVAMIVGHWDTKGAGASAQMAVPAFYDEMKVIAGCDALDKRGMLKFFMGHTHCNVVHPHGHVNTGFMVAGQGMEGCGNYGMPLIDTTGGRVRVLYFEITAKNGTDSYDAVTSCLAASPSWRSCTHLAETWLDQPIPSA